MPGRDLGPGQLAAALRCSVSHTACSDPAAAHPGQLQHRASGTQLGARDRRDRLQLVGASHYPLAPLPAVREPAVAACLGSMASPAVPGP